MKIEMGESLFYSWLRHVKECQIVQTNWTTSSQWQLNNEDRLEEIMTLTDKFFFDKYGYSIYKKTSSLSQLLQQAECDAIGIEIQDSTNKIYVHEINIGEFNGIELGEYGDIFASFADDPENPAIPLIRYMIALTRCPLDQVEDLLNMARGKYVNELDIPASDVEEDFEEEYEEKDE